MITVLIGHRGVGKTTVLERLCRYFQNGETKIRGLDLDHYIEQQEGISVQEIFKQFGEKHFRSLEQKYFQQIASDVKGQDCYIALGGGFDVSQLPPTVKVLWLQRPSDEIGRIFLNRPPLEPQRTPLDEFFHRAHLRQPTYLKAAWEEYLIPEGLKAGSPLEEQILLGIPQNVRGVLTLLPHHFEHHQRWSYFIRRRLSWGFDFFELRDDLLSREQMEWALRDIPNEKILWSRRLGSVPNLNPPDNIGAVDFDIHFFADDHCALRERLDIDLCSRTHLPIVSIHHREKTESLATLLERLTRWEKKGFHIKLAVEIMTFAELESGHRWQQESPEQRSFLPRSQEGKWLWYRLWRGSSQVLNFLREGQGSAPDQPSLYQWLDRKSKTQTFAAVLGDPVRQSFTPIEQGPFFAEFLISVFPISLSEEDFVEGMEVLKRFGLVAAAVTSPLKKLGYSLCQTKSSEAYELAAVNTIIVRDNGAWEGHNTDKEGFDALVQLAARLDPVVLSSQTLVWGGGGTLEMMKSILPRAHFYSAQTGLERESSFETLSNPRCVVWAGGRWDTPGCQRPPSKWRPDWVIDLNYREDSGGRELAQLTGARYLSGEEMFYEQAKGQRLFWRPFLEARCRSLKK